MFLSLLKLGGKMVVVIDEEAVLVTRGGDDAHDFSREVGVLTSAIWMADLPVSHSHVFNVDAT